MCGELANKATESKHRLHSHFLAHYLQFPSSPSSDYRSQAQWFPHSYESSLATRVTPAADQQRKKWTERSLLAWEEMGSS